MSEASINVSRWEAQINKWKHPYPEITTELVMALIWVESDGDPWAVRYEPGYQYFYDHKRKLALYDNDHSAGVNRNRASSVLGSTEFTCQSQSYGLLQLMGAAARERGFTQRWLTEMFDPELNIKFGTLHLYEWGFARGTKDLTEALTRWNGSDTYPAKVFAKLELLK